MIRRLRRWLERQPPAPPALSHQTIADREAYERIQTEIDRRIAYLRASTTLFQRHGREDH